MERLGTFEEWYQHEMKARDSTRAWHYPTELTTEHRFIHEDKKVKKSWLTVVYRARHTEQPGRGFIPVTYEPTKEN